MSDPNVNSSRLVPPYRIILNGLNDRQVIPFLGSGASLGGRAAGEVWTNEVRTFLPKADELAAYLANMAEFPSDGDKDLATVAQYYDKIAGRLRLNQKLHNIFSSEYSPGLLHKFLARIPSPLLIVTT